MSEGTLAYERPGLANARWILAPAQPLPQDIDADETLRVPVRKYLEDVESAKKVRGICAYCYRKNRYSFLRNTRGHQLDEKALCSGSAALDKINANLRSLDGRKRSGIIPPRWRDETAN